MKENEFVSLFIKIDILTFRKQHSLLKSFKAPQTFPFIITLYYPINLSDIRL